jgi:DNA polymerase-4
VALLNAVDTSDGVRLLGVGVSGLTDYAQQVLLADLDQPPADAPSDDEAQPLAVPEPLSRRWVPGQDVRHDDLGAGWVQGAGLGRVTVRFEGPHTAVGPVRTFAVDDPALSAAEPPPWAPLS